MKWTTLVVSITINLKWREMRVTILYIANVDYNSQFT